MHRLNRWVISEWFEHIQKQLCVNLALDIFERSQIRNAIAQHEHVRVCVGLDAITAESRREMLKINTKTYQHNKGICS